MKQQIVFGQSWECKANQLPSNNKLRLPIID